MPEDKIVQNTTRPNTISSLKADLRALGLKAGSIVIMHSALSKLGWTVGGPVAVIDALLDVLTPAGTLIMPTQTGSNTDPAQWENPPVPTEWWPIIRAEMPAYRPDVTPTYFMGVIPEIFRCYPGVIRSEHPTSSFAAWGQHTAIVNPHPLGDDLGERSALGRVYELDGQVLLLGVTHANNTSLHLSEHRANFKGKGMIGDGCAMLVDGEREWVMWEHLDYNSDDFERLGNDFEASIGYTPGKVGQASARLVSQRACVDFGVKWLEANR